MPQLLFEIGVEDLPAGAIDVATEFMLNFAKEELKKLRITHGEITTEGTPRRLVLMVKDLAVKQDALLSEICGPKVEQAYENGKLTKQALGFLSAKGIHETQIYHKQTDKGEVIAAKVESPAADTVSLLPELLLNIIRKIPFQKRMRWESLGDAFARPIRWIVALFGQDYLNISYADVASADFSFGHRFLAPQKFKVTSIEQYLIELKARHVMLSKAERAKLIVHDAQKKCEALGGKLSFDQEILDIVKNLVEYPFVIAGSFDKKYLALPAQLIISEMKTHQKCFAVLDPSSGIMPYFINVAGVKPYSEEAFAKGNEIVLQARFEDGAFYFEQDKKTGMKGFCNKLESLVFERDLGSMAHKVSRMQVIAQLLSEKLIVDKALLKRSVELCKADLVSGVVCEFPELQGIMGHIYAKDEKEQNQVSLAIEEHYYPRFSDDILPTTSLGAIISLADRLDTLVGIIGKGKKPTGNKDPFALRRAAIGIVRLLIEFGVNISISDLIKMAVCAYEKVSALDFTAQQGECEEFIVQRARVLLAEKLASDNAVSFADAVFAAGGDSLLDVFAKAYALLDFQKQDQEAFMSLTQTFKRASNIVKKNVFSEIEISPNKNLMVSKEEKELMALIDEANEFLPQKQEHKNFNELCGFYKKFFSLVNSIKPKLDAFFEKHMIMVDDLPLRAARLWLLNQIKIISEKLADFTHL